MCKSTIARRTYGDDSLLMSASACQQRRPGVSFQAVALPDWISMEDEVRTGWPTEVTAIVV